MSAREELLIRAAELYYQQGLSQSAVAEILGTSRPTVSRILEEARELGIVRITIQSSVKKNAELSKSLRNTFKLKDAIVIQGDYNYDEGLKKCGEVAAQFLLSILENNMNIGITWGPAIQYIINALEKNTDFYNIHIIQMAGTLGTGNPHLDGLELAFHLAERLNGTYSNIYAPVFVDNVDVYNHLLNEPQIANTLEKAQRLDIILTGIGSLFQESSTLQKAGYLNEAERQVLLKKGAVGHMLARMFNQNGEEIQNQSKYVVSAPLSTLKTAKWSIGLSASVEKAVPVLTAIRSNFINTLIADEKLAKELLRLHSLE